MTGRAVDEGSPPVYVSMMNAAALAIAADAAARERNLPTAVSLLEQAEALAPDDAGIKGKLAGCYRALGRSDDALVAIDAALALIPRDPLSLLFKATLLERAGADADEFYRAALAFLPDPAALPAPLRAQIAHARDYCTRSAARRRTALARVLEKAALLHRPDQREQGRMDAFADALATAATTVILPGLSRPGYFDAARFGPLPAIARRHAVFTAEYRALMDTADMAQPYVDHPQSAPLDQWASLNRSSAWRAAHLWRGGVRVPQVADRCPETMAAWSGLPVPDMPGRAPNLMFSILAPRTAIPRHVGVTNARLVVHVPLIIPTDCSLTVAADQRRWTPGEALVFDDTEEHEAANGSDEVRVVLIGDAWHPDLSTTERAVLRDLMAADTTEI